jgi:hypothetical protein
VVGLIEERLQRNVVGPQPLAHSATCALEYPIHALAQVYQRLIEEVSFWVYQELTEKTELLFNFISVLSVVSCRKNP